jgi:hypothetical protein
VTDFSHELQRRILEDVQWTSNWGSGKGWLKSGNSVLFKTVLFKLVSGKG